MNLFISILLLIPSSLSFPHSFSHSFSSQYKVQPPHCMKTNTIQSNGSKDQLRQWTKSLHFPIGIHSTVCFRLEDSVDNSTESNQSLLHTVTLTRLEHHHPVTQKYNFGIPLVQTDCFCECEQNDRCSSNNYEYIQCPIEDLSDKSQACYRTFFPNQSNKSCESSSSSGSNLCCDIKFTPYQNKTYTAVKLGDPSTFAIFTYVAYDYKGGEWIEKDRNTIRFKIDSITQENSIDSESRLRLEVSAWGRVSHQLESGMYFIELNEGGEMEGIRKEQLNELSDANLLHLGWYRRDENGHFYVKNGAVLLKNVHGAKVINCKEQTYSSNLAANFYMPGKFILPPKVEERHHWIERAAFYDGTMRNVIVSHSEGTNLQIGLHIGKTSSDSVVFLHNSSYIEDFSGSILVDSHSRHYLNLSLSHSSGKLNGVIHNSQYVQSPHILLFSVYVHEVSPTNRSLIISLPATTGKGSKLVCMRGEETKEENSICYVLPYHEEPLEIDIENDTWRVLKGNCPQCNDISSKNFLDGFNPLKLFSSVNSIGDAFTKTTNIFVYILILVILYLVITKLLLPFCQCCICPLMMIKIRAREERKTENQRRKRKENVVDGQFV